VTNFIPGKIIEIFETKKGNSIVIRYPKWEDLDSLTSFINEVSKEDTYITFSGEKVTKEEEVEHVLNLFRGIEYLNRVYLCCFAGSELVGTASIDRVLTGRRRRRHIGLFGITLAQKYRGEGIGEKMSRIIIEEAKRHIPGLTMLLLNVYGQNHIAQSLYKKLGFKEVGRMPKGLIYKGEYDEEINMVLDLEDAI